MTRDRSLKLIIRERMLITGETYMQAQKHIFDTAEDNNRRLAHGGQVNSTTTPLDIMREKLQERLLGLNNSPDENINRVLALVGASHQWNEIPLGIDVEGNEVIWNLMAHGHMLLTGRAGTGKTIVHNTILAHCLRQQNIKIIGIDFKKTDLAGFEKYSDVVLGVANNHENSMHVLTYAYDEMLFRLNEVRDHNVDHYTQISDPAPALIVIINETEILLDTNAYRDAASPNGSLSEDETITAKLSIQAMKELIHQISRKGRAAGVHLIVTTQRLHTNLLGNSITSNFDFRYATGQQSKVASLLSLNTETATYLPHSGPVGCAVVSITGEETAMRGYYNHI